MNIYVKEFSGILSVNAIIPWIKKRHVVLPLESILKVSIDDIIIISRFDSSISQENILKYTIFIYEDFFEKISLNIIQEHQYNYDYYYLKHALTNAANPHTTTIISGSSYGLFGIDDSMLSQAVNLSLMSQDLYYSLKGIYQVCSNNQNIKNIVLCLGYYYFFSDLSKTQNTNEIQRISKVYKPLYKDIHNCTLLPPKAEILYTSDIFDIQNVNYIYSTGEYEKGYFHKDHPRRNHATREWDDKNKEWFQLNESEKTEAGIRRAALHNKNMKREISLKENIQLFQDFLNYCNNNAIKLLLVVTPVTPYYLQHLSSQYKSIFYNILDEADGVIHLLDLSDDNTYTDEDFNDTDHLSDTGAVKMTQAILTILQNI